MKLLFKILFRGLFIFFKYPNQRRFIWLVFRYGDVARFKMKTIRINGFTIIVPDCLSFLWQYKEIFVEESYKFKSNERVATVIDCGANIGLGLFFYKLNYPDSRIIAFEANPDISKILKENIDNNHLKDIEIYNQAVWINDEGIELSVGNADNSSIFGTGHKVKIPSVTLSSVLEREQNIDFLKIDIEGAEKEVIANCGNLLRKVSNIFIEYHSFKDKKQELDDILSILTQNDFRYFIKPVNDRLQPFINKTNKNSPEFDLQLNIYAYKD